MLVPSPPQFSFSVCSAQRGSWFQFVFLLLMLLGCKISNSQGQSQDSGCLFSFWETAVLHDLWSTNYYITQFVQFLNYFRWETSSGPCYAIFADNRSHTINFLFPNIFFLKKFIYLFLVVLGDLLCCLGFSLVVLLGRFIAVASLVVKRGL